MDSSLGLMEVKKSEDGWLRSEIFLYFQVEVFCAVTPCSVVVGYQHFGGSKVFRNVSILPQLYTVSQHKKPRLDILSLQKYPLMVYGLVSSTSDI
jgi:hypothetical protein